MRTIIKVLFIISLIGCSQSSVSEIVMFSDSHGKYYRSDTVGGIIKNEYGLNENLSLILLATSNSDSEEFKSQLKIIKEIDAEEFQYLYVIANSDTLNKSGYYTSKIDAKNILGNTKFKIIIYDQHGDLVQSSSAVLEKKTILYYLTKSSSRH